LDQTAGALHEALVMPEDARHAQASRLHELAAAVTPGGWLQELINVACR
jgi:hypothetical protein